MPNTGDTVGDRHACQTNTGIEGTSLNAGDAVGDCHARQAIAVIEGMTPNAGDAVRDQVVATSSSWILNQTSLVFVE